MRTLLTTIAALAIAACAQSSELPTDGGHSGSGGTGGTGGSGGTSGTGGRRAGLCEPVCGEARECCDEHCVNLQNDPQHCGACDAEPCGDDEYCTQGRCTATPCTTSCGPGSVCCGSSCCASGQLCCDPQGPIDVAPRCLDPNEHGTCPMGCAPLCQCADPTTAIATPSGNRPISELQAGDLVYSVDRGQLAAVPIVRTRRTPVFEHSVMRIVLEGGAVLLISPGHPTADGRNFGELRSGNTLDGVAIASAELAPFVHDATYDILPASDTHAYFAAGVLIGSTLAPPETAIMSPTALCELPVAR